MTRAACAYGGGWLGVVIADGDATPFALRHSESFELGHNVGREEPLIGRRRSWDKVRAITPEHVAELGSKVLALLLTHDVEAVTFGLPHGPVSARLEEIAKLIEAAGVAVERVDAPEVRGEGARMLPLVEAALPGWPTGKGPKDGDAEVCRRAAALLLPMPVRDAPRGPWTPLTPRDNIPFPPSLVMDGPTLPEHQSLAAPPTADAVLGVRRGLIDTGERWVGVVVSEGDALPLRKIAARTFEIGEMVLRRKPKVKILTGGGERVSTHKHVVRGHHIDQLCDEIVAGFRAFEVEEVVIEWAPYVYSARASHIGLAQFVGGNLRRALLDAGFKVDVILRASWAARITGKAHATDSDVAVAVGAGFSNWPEIRETLEKDPDTHIRDAAGMAIERAIRPPAKEPAPPRTRREPGAPRRRVRPEKTDHRAELRRKTETREASNCANAGCLGRRHRGECVLSKPCVFRGWAESAMPTEEWGTTLPVRRDAARIREGWCSLTKARRDALVRARVVIPTFDLHAEFELCQVCRRPARDASGPLEPSEITCSCRQRAA